jgi:hypothetical protein
VGVRSSNRVIESALVRRPTFHGHSPSRVVDAIIRDAFSSLRAEQVALDARKNSPHLTCASPCLGTGKRERDG